MKITYLIYFIAILNLCSEVPALTIKDLIRNILDQFSDTTRAVIGNNTDEPTNSQLACGVSTNHTATDRIVGGEAAKPYEFPWLVSLQTLLNGKYYHYCGGSIVHPLFVLTAGHCVYKISSDKIRIAAGKFRINEKEEHEQLRDVLEIFLDSYDEKTFNNDIALLKLKEPLKFEPPYIAPGCLATNENFKKHAIAAGWGVLKKDGNLPNELQKVSLSLLDTETCYSMYKKKRYNKLLHKCQICALDKDQKDTCQGDSGGPLMCVNVTNDKLLICGVVSWGLGCAEEKSPGVYTKVSCYVDWINQVINNN